MRFISLLATIVTAISLWFAGYRISRRRDLALIGPGLFFAGYALTGTQYELARVDSLMMAFVMVGTRLGLIGGSSRKDVSLSALCFALGFFAKQTAIVFGLGMAAYLFVANRKQAWIYATCFVTLVGLPILLMDQLTNHWSTIYLFEVPESDPILLNRIVSYVRHDLLLSLAPLCFSALASYLLTWRRDIIAHPFGQAWLLFTLLALIDSGWLRARLGGNLNSLMPAYTFLCLAPVILLQALSSIQRSYSLRRIVCSLVYVAVLWQCLIGLYDPVTEIPSMAMLQGGQHLIRRIAQAPGPVLVLEHPYYALLAGKSPGVALTALWHARAHGAAPLPADLVQRIHQEFYSAIIADEGTYSEVEAAVSAEMSQTYRLADTLGATDSAQTLSGVIVRPAQVYTPKPRIP